MMSKVRFNIAMSLDGFVAGPNQSVENPLGIGGMRLHDWAFALAAWRKPHGLEGGEVNASTRVVEESLENVGAVLMGRNMFGGQPGPWNDDDSWNGWWGENPPFHTPVFVLTHHPRRPLPMQGGTTFTFVTDGIESALEQAMEAARSKDVVLAGGASIAQQYLGARLIDEVNISLVPLFLRGGERLFDNLGAADLELEQIRAIEAPGVTHLKYRLNLPRDESRGF
jgi:dihydrofolate reductase